MIQFYDDDHKARYEDLMQRMIPPNVRFVNRTSERIDI